MWKHKRPRIAKTTLDNKTMLEVISRFKLAARGVRNATVYHNALTYPPKLDSKILLLKTPRI